MSDSEIILIFSGILEEQKKNNELFQQELGLLQEQVGNIISIRRLIWFWLFFTIIVPFLVKVFLFFYGFFKLGEFFEQLSR